jgi:hypothetical protein
MAGGEEPGAIYGDETKGVIEDTEKNTGRESGQSRSWWWWLLRRFALGTSCNPMRMAARNAARLKNGLHKEYQGRFDVGLWFRDLEILKSARISR